MFKKTIAVWLLFAGVLFAEPGPKPGTFYKHGELGIKKTELKGTTLHLTFKPRDEQFHWCPGIKVKTTDKATVVTFVRCATSKNASIDKKAKIGKKLIRTISIDTKNKDTYIREGEKKFKKIFSAPKKKKPPAAKPKVGSKSRPRVTGANSSAHRADATTKERLIKNAFADPGL